MVNNFNRIFDHFRTAFQTEKVFERAKALALSAIVCLSRKTITGMLTTQGKQFSDWSAEYRIFERERIDMPVIFNQILNLVEENLDKSAPLSIAIDDTRIKKRGRKIYGTKWDRDPLGPPFHTNFIWGQRFLQFSALLPENTNEPGRARAIPIQFEHCPTPPKPKKTAPQSEWDTWKEEKKLKRLPLVANQHLHELRSKTEKTIIASVDGGYTNSTLIKNLPSKTIVIGRIRKDAKIFDLPDIKKVNRGRRIFYGAPLKTPDEFRTDESIPWIEVNGFAAGRTHTFNLKIIDPIRWRGAGEKNLRLIIIKPLRYRLTLNSKLLYREPAYLICTDKDLTIEEILQNYIWRWEIEVNFRDEKSILGLGEAQTRTASSATLVPQFKAATYAMLLLSTYYTFGFEKNKNVIQPKWQKINPKERISTRQMISLMRTDLWQENFVKNNKTDFVENIPKDTKSVLFSNHLFSSVYFSSR